MTTSPYLPSEPLASDLSRLSELGIIAFPVDGLPALANALRRRSARPSIWALRLASALEYEIARWFHGDYGPSPDMLTAADSLLHKFLARLEEDELSLDVAAGKLLSALKQLRIDSGWSLS